MLAPAPPQQHRPPSPPPPQYEQPQYQPPPAATPYFPGVPPQPAKHTKRNVLITLLVLVVAAGAAVGIILGTGSKGNGPAASSSSGGASQVSANFSALLTRVPQSVRGSCTDISDQLPKEVKSFVQVLASCRTIVNGSAVTIQYRTLLGDANNIKVYRTSRLGLGGSLNSPGDCQNLLSTNPNLHGTHGYAENVNSPPIVGGVWCEFDGTLWYLQSSPASGNLPIMTGLMFTQASALQPQKRYSDLESVVPTS